ncbi:addiction module toxin RelE [Thiocystis minor]|uniref:type II toxin-antitoxin system RelE/ParE family toxin n=1 Tax=Thiocystis minor TaxID=61597 RepID=UPI001914CF29|nr:type II toxin-antitoxin system RelE/ParE family toxin [Thiocystis minor]MBK5966093.1 addiction module toxin RelE [Thiocystis minor]
MKVTLQQRPSFKRAYKKLHANQRDAVHAAIREIVADPTLGEEKKGDLAGVRAYKFDCVNQQFLLAYRSSETMRTLLAVGPHENFYRDLKR